MGRIAAVALVAAAAISAFALPSLIVRDQPRLQAEPQLAALANDPADVTVVRVAPSLLRPRVLRR